MLLLRNDCYCSIRRNVLFIDKKRSFLSLVWMIKSFFLSCYMLYHSFLFFEHNLINNTLSLSVSFFDVFHSLKLRIFNLVKNSYNLSCKKSELIFSIFDNIEIVILLTCLIICVQVILDFFETHYWHINFKLYISCFLSLKPMNIVLLSICII
jgi:hypothetical protein